MPVTIKGQTYYRTSEVSRMVGICRTTLYRWVQKGILGQTEYRDKRGWRLFTKNDVNRLSAEAEEVISVNRLVKGNEKR
jgi:predicted site-specific integrase-resolvase